MQSVNIGLTANEWFQIDQSGSVIINHRSGGIVLYSSSDSEPGAISSSTAILGSTRQGEDLTLEGIGSDLWAISLNEDSVVSVTDLVTASSTTVKYDGLTQPLVSTQSMSMSELYSSLGRRYSHKFDLTFTGSEEKYFLYNLGEVGDDVIIAVQERIFKSLNDSAQLEVFTGSTGFTATTKVTNIISSRPNLGRSADMDIYNLTDGSGNVEPSGDGTEIDTDFITGSGNGNNTTGGFSPQTGSRFYDEGTSIVVKVTNLDNSDNRISIEYSWLELPIDYLD